MSTAGYSRMVHDAFSERQQQQGGGWEALDPPVQNDGGMHPPAVDAPAYCCLNGTAFWPWFRVEWDWDRGLTTCKEHYCLDIINAGFGFLPRLCAMQSTDIDARRRLRSAATSTLIFAVNETRTLGDRAFPVAAARAWNGLPSSIRVASSLQLFWGNWRQRCFHCHLTFKTDGGDGFFC